MPQFFFTVVDGKNSQIQDEGLDLPDDHAAWIEATIACGELLRELDGRLNPGDQWSMAVKDETGRDLYLLEFKTQKFR
jgi:hypothetical protein